VEALVAQDLSGAVLLLSITLGGLIVGTILGTWVHYTEEDRMVSMAVTGALIGMMLVGGPFFAFCLESMVKLVDDRGTAGLH
jgi:hypothetical protein